MKKEKLSGKRRPGALSLTKLVNGLERLDGGDAWSEKILPQLKMIETNEIVARTGLSRSEVYYLKSGKRRPGPETVEKLLALLPAKKKTN